MIKDDLTKELSRRIAARTIATVALFLLAFAGLAMAAERTVFPVLGDAVADVVSPWTEATADSFPVETQEMFQERLGLVRADVAREYALSLCYSAAVSEGKSSGDVIEGLYDSAEDALAVGGSCADRVLRMDLRSIEELALSVPDVDDLLSCTDEAACANSAGETVEWPVFAKASVALARQEGYAQARDRGMALGDAVGFTAGGEDDYPFDRLVRFAFELRNAGAAGSVYDGVWRMTRLWSESPELESAYRTAVESIGESGEIQNNVGTVREDAGTRMVVLAASYEDGTVQAQFLGDGSALRRDLTAYNELKSWKIPVLAVLSFLGVCAILWASARRSLGYFDELMACAKSVADKGTLPRDVSKDLRPARKVFEKIASREEAARQDALVTERRKNELVAYLAHDTKTPLTSVVGYLSVLDESPDLPEGSRRKYVKAALRKACRLDSMVDEFFEIARFNISSLSIERAWFDPAILCWQVAEELAVVAEGRGIRIEVEAEEGRKAYADAAMLSRAVANLLKNAVAYAYDKTEVRLVLEPFGAAEDGGFGISVSNEGKEISPEHLQRIFEKFYREDSSRSSERGGAGLGLAIAKEIVEAHGGSISARCHDGVTVFSIEIPGKEGSGGAPAED